MNEKDFIKCLKCGHEAWNHSSTGCHQETLNENESEYNQNVCDCELTYEQIVNQT